MYGTLCYHILPHDFRTFTIVHPFVWVHVEYYLFFFGLARQPGPMWQHARALRNRAQEPSNSSCWSCHSKWGWRENFQNELGSMTIFLQPHFEFSNRLDNIGQGVHDDYVWTILDIFTEIFTASRPICVVFTTHWVRRPPCFFLEQWHGETRVLQVKWLENLWVWKHLELNRIQIDWLDVFQYPHFLKCALHLQSHSHLPLQAMAVLSHYAVPQND